MKKKRKTIPSFKFSRDYKYFAYKHEKKKNSIIEVVSYEDLNQRISFDIRDIISDYDHVSEVEGSYGGEPYSFQFANEN